MTDPNTLSIRVTEQQEEVLTKLGNSIGRDSIAEVMAAGLTSGLKERLESGSNLEGSRGGEPMSPSVSGETERVEPRFEGARFYRRLEPVQGKAVPVYKGEILRVAQVEGGQCVDFNCFNLHNYRERMSVGHCRRQGFRLTEGNVIFSNPPHFRPLLLIGYMSPTVATDILGPRCHAALFELGFGLEWHTNCQDTLAEAIREYDLTPDDVHDSFNIFMNTRLDENQGWVFEHNSARTDDFVDLIACMDTLSVPIICGSGDLSFASNGFLKPIDIGIFPPTSESSRLAEQATEFFAAPASQARAAKYADTTSNELVAKPDYVPQYPRAPIGVSTYEVELPSPHVAELERMAEELSTTVEDCAHRLMLTWILKEMPQPAFAPNVGEDLVSRWE